MAVPLPQALGGHGRPDSNLNDRAFFLWPGARRHMTAPCTCGSMRARRI